MIALMRAELRRAGRAGGGAWWGIGFFALLALCLPLTQPHDLAPDLRAANLPGALWLGALVGGLLGLDRIWSEDHSDGRLDLLRLSALPLERVVLAKTLSHWLLSGVPISALATLTAAGFGLPLAGAFWLGGTLLCGGLAFALIGGFCAALALGQGGALLGLICLPFCAPVLVMGAGTARAPWSFGPDLALLVGITLMSAAILPFATAAALRIER